MAGNHQSWKKRFFKLTKLIQSNPYTQTYYVQKQYPGVLTNEGNFEANHYRETGKIQDRKLD